MIEHKPLAFRWFLIALILGLAAWAFLAARSPAKPWGMALGQDLRGGTTLRFHLDIEGARRGGGVDSVVTDASLVDSTLALLQKRINKFGLEEVNLTPLGENRFEISVPAEVDADAIQRVVEALGELEFRIEVLPSYPAADLERGARRTRDRVWEGARGTPGAAGAEPEAFEATPDGFTKFKAREVERWKEARRSGEKYKALDARYKVVPHYRGENAPPPSQVHEFAVVEEPQDPSERLGGKLLANVTPSRDRNGRPAVSFDVRVDYQNVFEIWTGKNVGLPMAIILNGQFDSAPTINSALKDSVIVTLGGGSGFGDTDDSIFERQKNLIATLQSGSLEVMPRFEAKSRVGPTLAGEAVRRGLLSTAIAFVLVLLYMAIYYFAAGLIANLALMLNLVLIVGAMAFLRSTLTLPGIAGVVLTLGMAVDANILIFERIREELKRGRSAAQAVAEGFDRAFTTIVDSNVTTFLTALCLYAFGSGAIQGFAVTLTLGLLASMFTSVYVTRTIFEAWVRRGATTIRMLGEARVPSIGWMKLRRYFLPASVAAVAASLALFALTPDPVVYDIDFTGGMKLQARFNKPTTVDEVKSALDSGPLAVRIPREGAALGSGEMESVTVGPFGGAEVVTVRSEGRWVEVRHPLDTDEGALSPSSQLNAFRAYIESRLAARLIPSWVVARPAPYKSTGPADAWKDLDGGLVGKIAIEDPGNVVTPEMLKEAFARMPFYAPGPDGQGRSAYAPKLLTRSVEVRKIEVAGETKVFEVGWKSRRTSDGSEVENDPEALVSDWKEFLAGADFRQALIDAGVARKALDDVVLADPFPVNDLVGPGVAQRMRNDALIALLLSFVAIILYVAFRFRSYAMGFAAVLCLVHDVTIALGAVCLVNHFGWVDAKINLGLVAAFLTIVGFSVNDTVVTFDRIRELRGKAPGITSRMIDAAVNQTLARTIRTSVTVFLTLVVLFLVNFGQRSLLEGFSFTMLVGVVVGSYSTIGIAAPLLLFLPWFWTRVRKYRPQTWALTWPARKNYALLLAGAAVVVAVAVYVIKGDWFFAAFLGLVMVPVSATLGLWLIWAVVFSLGAAVWGAVAVVPWASREDPDSVAERARAEIEARAAAAAGPPTTMQFERTEPDEPKKAKGKKAKAKGAEEASED